MIDGLYILTVAGAFAALLTIWTYSEWARWDEYRRLERKAHRNIQRQTRRYVTAVSDDA